MNRIIIVLVLVLMLGGTSYFLYSRYKRNKGSKNPFSQPGKKKDITTNESGKKMVQQRFDVRTKVKEETGKDLSAQYRAQQDLKRNVVTLGMYSRINPSSSARKTINQECKKTCGCNEKGICVGNKKRKCVRDCKSKIKEAA